jgi:hypothetical protein
MAGWDGPDVRAEPLLFVLMDDGSIIVRDPFRALRDSRRLEHGWDLIQLPTTNKEASDAA